MNALMKQIVTLLFLGTTATVWGQWKGNTSPNYTELISIYENLAAKHAEIEMYEMGPSDYGLPIYLVVVNGAGDSTKTFEKARSGTTLLINNAIHPGEPDGVNACLIWLDEWIEKGKPSDLPVVAIIPAYNVGGMMNRSGTSRANQDGPEEYGFRGNAQNLDLNRDFIKMDSKNMFTFAKIYQGLDPDVFIDTHVSNGADYQYSMTYIASVRERMAPSLGDLMHDTLIPTLKKMSSEKGFDLTPYVDTRDEVPESGIVGFNDLPRYAMGYASLFNALSFTTETHMLKPFPQRVEATYVFLCSTITWMRSHQNEIETARQAAKNWDAQNNYFKYNYVLTSDSTEILFKGFEFSRPISAVTGLPRLKYHRDRPFEKMIPYFNRFEAQDSIAIPRYVHIGGQCSDVIARLKANGVQMTEIQEVESAYVSTFRIAGFESTKAPYEGHFLHSKVQTEFLEHRMNFKPGDVIVPMDQPNRRFILSVLVPDAPDSYFTWNFFDSYVQQKEYFSAYVFEDYAEEMLKKDEHLRKEFEIKKSSDASFAESEWAQLYFLYKRSPYYEPMHNVLPVSFVNPVER